MWAMIRASELATQLPGAFFYVRSFTLVETLLWYGLLLGTLSGWLFAAKRRKWTLPALGLVAIAYGWARFQQSQLVTLTAIPLSGGSAVYCDFPGGRRDLLIDCGTTNAIEFVTKPFLRAQGVNRLPQLLLTHGDLRCIGGAEDVLREFRVQQVFASGVRQLSATYRRVMTNLNHTPDRLRVVQRGDAAGPFTVSHPAEGDRFKQADDNAVVLRGEIHGTRVLLLSDLGRPGQEKLMERETDLRADLVIAGQPAQGEAVCDALLDRMQPRVLVIVDSEFPAPERASPRLRARLADWADRQHATVLYTRETGAVQIQLRRGSWTLRTMKGVTMRMTAQTNVGGDSP
jgi:beta-lactamase superfamily II metal-dependent hydrolase